MTLGAAMRNVFISHAGADSRIAIRIAKGLEKEGYSTWYYERDALPGTSHLIQSGDAIDRSNAFLLLISERSLESHDVTTEVRKAHRRNRHILPIRVRISDAEFRIRQPEWDSVISTAVSKEFRGSDPKSILPSVVEALRRWDVRPSEPAAEPRLHDGKSAPQSIHDVVWPSDANQIDIRDLKKVVFKNDIIEDFLQSRSKYFLAANKGLGKTLLLTYKRSLLADAYQEQKRGKRPSQVFFVPEGRPYLDFMSDLNFLRRQHKEFLEQVVNTKRLWSFALLVSALSHHPSLVSEDDDDELSRFPKHVREWIRGSKVEPTIVFKEMLDHSVGDINRVMTRTGNFLEQKFRRLHSGTFIFIDKVDQGVKHLSRSAWIAVQAGLIEAAWDLMNANNHVKIYASIRQEAFSNYESDIKTNLFGATTIIQYTRDELDELLDQLTQCYEGGKTYKEFIGLNVVKHPRRSCPEDSFHYLHRHTLGRPRDLVIISSTLSSDPKSLSEPFYRQLVNETSAAAIVSNVFDEMRVFLGCLAEREERLRFLSLLPHNVLTREEAIDICCEFNGIDKVAFSALYDPNSDHLHHPFWELYSAGLLGVVTDDPESRKTVQKFKQPHDMINDSQSALPDVRFYLIHPALDGFIRKRRAVGVYNVFQHVAVGHRCDWEDYLGTICEVERYLFQVSDSELRELTYHVLNEITVLLRAGRREKVPGVLEAADEWRALTDRLARENHEDLEFWLTELIS